ncbi:MAG: hypothetical protein BJ554DRAFT_5263, partial [Olpidium bornovanus]
RNRPDKFRKVRPAALIAEDAVGPLQVLVRRADQHPTEGHTARAPGKGRSGRSEDGQRKDSCVRCPGNADFRGPAENRPRAQLLCRSRDRGQKRCGGAGASEPHEHTRRHARSPVATHGPDGRIRLFELADTWLVLPNPLVTPFWKTPVLISLRPPAVTVLDEADRILDMGFETTLNAIIENLPKERQTLLYSATQTKSVRDLARLSLSDPEYIAVHERSKSATPAGLSQHYMVTSLENKLNILWSFLKTHLQTKGIVFVSSCKQVRFIFESFCKMHPGVPLLHIHGKQKQSKRVEVFERFSSINHGYLFSTDVGARGLDFPAVNWVIQLDCPDDADTYIHRVGRTARFGGEGRALLILLPNEEAAMVDNLRRKKVPIEKITMRQSKALSVKQQLQAACFQDPELKYLGQKAFVSYMRSVYLQKDKSVFDVHALPAEAFAESLGLPGAPKIKFVKKNSAKDQQASAVNAEDRAASPDEKAAIGASERRAQETNVLPKKKIVTKIDKMFNRQNQTVLTSHYSKMIDQEDAADSNGGGEAGLSGAQSDDEDFMTIRRKDHDLDENTVDKSISKGLKGKDAASLNHKEILRLRKQALAKQNNEKLVFDDDGGVREIETQVVPRSATVRLRVPLFFLPPSAPSSPSRQAHPLYELETLDSFNRAGPAAEQTAKFVAGESERMRDADGEDRDTEKRKRREKRLHRKRRESLGEDGVQCSLGSAS